VSVPTSRFHSPNTTQEHVLKYESQLNAELAQAKQAHQQDVAALRAELATEEQRRRNAKEVTKEWKLKHEEVAKEASEWKRKYESVREKFAKSKERNRRLKDRASIKKEEED
jgi:transketolase